MRGRMFWEALWPWLYYEFIAAFIYLMYGWYFGDMAVMLIAMAASAPVLVPVYLYRQRIAEPKTGAPGWGTLAAAAVSTCVLFNMILIFSGIDRLTDSREAVNEILFGAPFWFQLLVMGAAAPVTEELIYRGMAYARFREEMGVRPAAALSAVFFAVTHGNILQGIYTGMLGLFLALAYELGGLKAAVWFHVWANLTSIGVNCFSASCPELAAAPWVSVFLLAAGGVGTVIGAGRMMRSVRSREEYNIQRRG